MKNSKDYVSIVLGIFCVLVGIYILAPLVIVVINSFNAASYSVFPPAGFSLQWYQRLLETTQFVSGFKNSVIVATVAVAIGLLVGIPASYSLSRYSLPGRSLMHSMLVLPLAIPKIVLGLSLFIYFVQIGLYDSLIGLGLGHSLLVLPYIVVMATSAIKNISRQQEEAAMDLGAKPMVAFATVLLPQISTAMILAAALGFIVSFDQVEASLFLVRSDNYTLPLEMMNYMEKYQNPTIAALSTVLMLLVLSVLAILILSLRKKGNIGQILASSQKR